MAISRKSTFLGTLVLLIALVPGFISCYSDGHYRTSAGFYYGHDGSYDFRYRPYLGYPYRYPYSTLPGSRFRHYQQRRGRHFPPSFYFRYHHNWPYHYYPFRYYPFRR
jgi:hypothetical protein